ncbi:MAG: 3-dehydroquinate synthase [Cyclobacteriaceae bacterium]|nr:3-dehydroquinate synthase [Cyclobacteriaceae bacterium]
MNPIIFGEVKDSLSKVFAAGGYSRYLILVDENTRKHCLPVVAGILPADITLIEINSGEENKNLNTCQQIWSEITAAHTDRHALFINLGGGVIGDMGGFCASTYKRGIDFINVPTTLLSQVDASVGGKLGIDFQGFKNHIGLFLEPKHVLIDPVFLLTLPQQELRSGFAEVIKHCLIYDKAYWEVISGKSLDEQSWEEVIPHSVGVKKKIVESDFRETGLRKILNFGHTLGHAVESYFLEQPGEKLLHGEAIAIGMICEGWLSVRYGSLEQTAFDEIESYLTTIYGRQQLADERIAPVIELMKQDKKNKDGKILFTLLDGLGKACYDVALTEEMAREALLYYNGD